MDLKPLALARLLALYRAVRETMADPYEHVPSRIRMALYDVERDA